MENQKNNEVELELPTDLEIEEVSETIKATLQFDQ